MRRQETFSIHADTNGMESLGPDGLHRRRVRIFFCQYAVATFGKHTEHRIGGKGVANCQSTMPIAIQWTVDHLGALGHETEKRWGASALPIIQSDAEIIQALSLGNVLLRGRRAEGGLSQLVQISWRPRYLQAHFLYREDIAAGEATTERYHARVLEILTRAFQGTWHA